MSARILYGLSAAGIAVDLGIGIESVTTYRKRAYRRLGIATQRELLVWYLKLRGRRKNAPADAVDREVLNNVFELSPAAAI